jgi:hypothetical protein
MLKNVHGSRETYRLILQENINRSNYYDYRMIQTKLEKIYEQSWVIMNYVLGQPVSRVGIDLQLFDCQIKTVEGKGSVELRI